MEPAPCRFITVSRIITGANTIPLFLGTCIMVKLWEIALIAASPGQWYQLDLRGTVEGSLALYGSGVAIFLAHLRACFSATQRYVLYLWIATLVYNAVLLGLSLSLSAPLTWLSLWPGITCGVALFVLASLAMPLKDSRV